MSFFFLHVSPNTGTISNYFYFQMDQFESEIESLLATQKKKKMDKDKSDRIEDLKNYIERHQFHIKKLEILMRMLDNQSIDCEQVRGIRNTKCCYF